MLGYIFTAATLVAYARKHGLDKNYPNSNDLISDLARASLNDMITKANVGHLAYMSAARKGRESYFCLALYSNTPEKDYFTRKPTKDEIRRVIAATGIAEVPKWYKCIV